jgi:hypothetical protein
MFMKYSCISLLVMLLFSCSKSKTGKEGNNFITMTIRFYATANPCTGYYFLYDDTASINKYNADSIPANAGITTFPVTMQVSFHDVPNRCNGIDLVQIDEIKK